MIKKTSKGLQAWIKRHSIHRFPFSSHDFSSNLYYSLQRDNHASKRIYFFLLNRNLHRSFFKFYFHLKIDYSFEDSQSPQRFAREFSLWCGRGTEPSAIARGRGETKIIDLIEGADKRPFTSLWITLCVSTCIYIRYIYILACLIRLDEQPDG